MKRSIALRSSFGDVKLPFRNTLTVSMLNHTLIWFSQLLLVGVS